MKLILLLLLAAVLSHVVQADIVQTPLCAEVLGFAGTLNDHIAIPIEEAIGAKEAIVLIATPFSPRFGLATRQWLQVNATYQLSSGVDVSVTSTDDNGIVIIRDVQPGTSITISINRARIDGPVPFRFLSFHANSPNICRVRVAPDNAFSAPIPAVLPSLPGSAPTPVTVFFETVLPPAHSAVAVRVAVGGASNPLPFYSLSPDGSQWLRRVSDEVIPAPADGRKAVVFSVTPEAVSGMLDDQAVSVSVSYAEYSGGGSSATAMPSTGSTTSPSSEIATHSKQSRGVIGVLGTISIIILAVLLFYLLCGTVYNVQVREKQDVHEIVPHYEVFQACARCMSLASSRLCGWPREGYSRGGYDSLRGDDDHYA